MAQPEVIQLLASGREDLHWFNSQVAMLLEKFNNTFIAFRNKEVIASAETIDALLGKLSEARIEPSTVLIRFISKVKSIL